ncbi:hypothetical protein BCR34DRAFT_607108 [Clohesyomyces aquaticus]|uniref:Uncharacterized protein n=1 Tax=Clohesyomyces aquaticus TaxID=1231657 RepID=A0A1Y1YIU7_9PLEO|nr:hypothetical protein BCR34DRAFT_607108 [Clohesyomyces aquaticus]
MRCKAQIIPLDQTQVFQLPLTSTAAQYAAICSWVTTSGCRPAPQCVNYGRDYRRALNISGLPSDWTKCLCTRFSEGNPQSKAGHSLYSDAIGCDSASKDFITEQICTGIAYTPWDWTVQHNEHSAAAMNKASSCPSPARILGTFAAINVVVAIGSIVLGHRLVVYRLTCGLLGKPNSSLWKVLWVLPVGLQLGANALIAYLIKITPGYGNGFSLYQLTLFLCARPRLTWFIGVVLATSSRLNGKNQLQQRKSPWQSFGFTQIIAEFILQGLMTISVGYTAGFAAKRVC